jgi:hypothetical protein
MSADLLSDVFHSLDLFVVERMPDSSFIAVTRHPGWLTPILAAAGNTPTTLAQTFPFLDSFLRDAEAFWHSGTGPCITSGAFVVDGRSGELLIRASALNLGERRVLVLERLRGEADTRPLLQKARENTLQHEQLARQIGTLQKSMVTISRLAAELLDTDLTAAQRHHAERIATNARVPSE